MSASWSGRTIAALLLLTGLAVAAGDNLVTYHAKLLQQQQLAQQLAGEQECDDEHNTCNLDVRHNFYALLGALKRDSAYHGEQRFGVVVMDPDFFKGAYVKRPSDTVLKPCSIQPFSVPALAGLPLLSALRARTDSCQYDSYGYQYLPSDVSANQITLTDPCALARLRGFENVVVIRRQGESFSAERKECAAE